MSNHKKRELKFVKLRLFLASIKDIKPFGWLIILLVASIIILLAIYGSGGYDSSAERPSFFD